MLLFPLAIEINVLISLFAMEIIVYLQIINPLKRKYNEADTERYHHGPA